MTTPNFADVELAPFLVKPTLLETLMLDSDATLEAGKALVALCEVEIQSNPENVRTISLPSGITQVELAKELDYEDRSNLRATIIARDGEKPEDTPFEVILRASLITGEKLHMEMARFKFDREHGIVRKKIGNPGEELARLLDIIEVADTDAVADNHRDAVVDMAFFELGNMMASKKLESQFGLDTSTIVEPGEVARLSTVIGTLAVVEA